MVISKEKEEDGDKFSASEQNLNAHELREALLGMRKGCSSKIYYLAPSLASGEPVHLIPYKCMSLQSHSLG